MSTFWHDFLLWHVRTEHRWDLALHFEAMNLGIKGMAREIGEALLPVIPRTADRLLELGL